MEEDISKKTIAVLLTITLVLSAMGTWLMLTSSPGQVIYGSQAEPTPQAGGKVSFGYVDTDEFKSISKATGNVAFEFEERR